MSEIIQKVELSKIFLPSDRVYICGTLQDSGGYSNPKITTLETLKIDAEHLQFCINPLTSVNRNPNPQGSIRALCNVAAYRNFLFESDSVSPELIIEALPVLADAVPIRLAIHSGKKSVHLIVSVADHLDLGATGHEFYKAIWRGIDVKLSKALLDYANSTERWKHVQPELDAANLTVFDQSTKDAVRLSRIPGAIRNGVEQAVLYTGKFTTSDDLLPLAIFPKTTNFVVGEALTTLFSFKRKLATDSRLSGLRYKFVNVEKWAAPAGMYIEIFKLSLWAIDATNVTEEVLTAYMNAEIFPKIYAKGYPRNLNEGIINAYRYKNILTLTGKIDSLINTETSSG